MSIQTKDWYAQDDKMPGVNTFKVTGIVSLPYRLQAVLVRSASPGAGNQLSLDLMVESRKNAITNPVERDESAILETPVSYTQPSGADITGVSIFYKGALLVNIDNVQITH
ncbi:hypothetical protein [Pseudomonas syringae]|uniref:Uncharacterized protein n=1 Tax=Pseudomonas syringae TaxID=317 RepID=A0A085VJ27_PSESX|nr:hypothetical protein [Pseudomonas syringae]KFE55440.1 hypothetical protein IV01_12505 [Pseudomonas syringae]